MVDDDVTHATRAEIEHIWEHIDVIEETVGITKRQEEKNVAYWGGDTPHREDEEE